MTDKVRVGVIGTSWYADLAHLARVKSHPRAELWIVSNGLHIPVFDQHAAAFTQTALEFLRGEWDK